MVEAGWNGRWKAEAAGFFIATVSGGANLFLVLYSRTLLTWDRYEPSAKGWAVTEAREKQEKRYPVCQSKADLGEPKN